MFPTPPRHPSNGDRGTWHLLDLRHNTAFRERRRPPRRIVSSTCISRRSGCWSTAAPECRQDRHGHGQPTGRASERIKVAREQLQWVGLGWGQSPSELWVYTDTNERDGRQRQNDHGYMLWAWNVHFHITGHDLQPSTAVCPIDPVVPLDLGALSVSTNSTELGCA